MKRFMAVLLVLFLLCPAHMSAFAMADSADCACVINAATGEVIFSKNIAKRHAMASTTKIMTALLALENASMDDVVTVSERAALEEGSAAYIEAGMEISMRDLLYGLMLSSGNDAAIAVAEHIGGSVEEFVDMMNLRAAELGAHGTHFVNPSGLYDDAHFTTASDLAMITRYAMKIPEFREIVATPSYEAHALNSPATLAFYNHNKLLEWYEGSTGVKTGYTEKTGRCLVSSAMRDNMEFIAVTLDDNDDWHDHAEMLDYAFSLHYPKKAVEQGMKIKIAKIDGREYNMVAAEDFVIPFKENGRTEAEIITHIASDITGPVNEGEKMGYLEILIDGSKVGEVDIISESDIMSVSGMRLRNSFYSTFMSVIKRILI